MMETVRPRARQFLRERCVSSCVGVGSMSWLGRDTVPVQYVRIEIGTVLMEVSRCFGFYGVLSFLDHMETPVWLPVGHLRLPIFFFSPRWLE